jgi:hypothetical protein
MIDEIETSPAFEISAGPTPASPETLKLSKLPDIAARVIPIRSMVEIDYENVVSPLTELTHQMRSDRAQSPGHENALRHFAPRLHFC